MANKFLARRIKWRGDDLNMLPKEQAGGRKHHRAKTDPSIFELGGRHVLL